MSSTADFSHMNVKRLKRELSQRDLPTHGRKPALLERLKHAIAQPDDQQDAALELKTAAPTASLLDRLVDQQDSPLLEMVLAKVPEEDAFVVQLSSVRLQQRQEAIWRSKSG